MSLKICSIASSSSGNCIYIGSSHTHLLVDVGVSGKKIIEGLQDIVEPQNLSGILITHEHIDHIKGLGVLVRKFHIPIYCTHYTQQAIIKNTTLGHIDPDLFRIIPKHSAFLIDDIEIVAHSIPHDAVDPVCYTFKKEQVKIGIATDLGTYTDAIVDHLKACDILFLEANHDVNMLMIGSYPYPLKRRILSDVGHLSNVTSGNLIKSLIHPGLKYIILGHLSKENNFPELAFETIKLELLGFDGFKLDELTLFVAEREKRSKLISL